MALPTKPYAIRKLTEPCPFCRQDRSVELWVDPREHYKPFQVICGVCQARGPVCDCGEEVAVPAWLSVKRVPGLSPSETEEIE